jgi:FixJ family two-component response regulator
MLASLSRMGEVMGRQEPAPIKRNHGHQRLVVVIDDDPDVRTALARLLHSVGYDVRTFANAEEFLEQGEMEGVACLVLDVYLGGMTGIDLLARLEWKGRAPPAVFITAHDDAMAEVRLRYSSRVTSLQKPYEADRLLEAIRECMRAAGK